MNKKLNKKWMKKIVLMGEIFVFRRDNLKKYFPEHFVELLVMLCVEVEWLNCFQLNDTWALWYSAHLTKHRMPNSSRAPASSWVKWRLRVDVNFASPCLPYKNDDFLNSNLLGFQTICECWKTQNIFECWNPPIHARESWSFKFCKRF